MKPSELGKGANPAPGAGEHTQVRVLMVEDSPLDMEVNLRELLKAGYAPEYVRVDDESAYLAALATEPELILCDYNMPHFDGLRALELLRERGHDTPFILISGTMGEELAINALKCGADDYLLKDNLIRLGPTVKQALKSKRLRDQRKHDDALLRQQAAALEAAANAILITDLTGAIVWHNSALTRLTGYSAEELIGQNPRRFKSGKHGPAFYQELWDTIRAGHVWNGEIINRHKDGHLYTERDTITPVVGEGGEITHFIAIKEDITEKIQAEATIIEQLEELRRWQKVMLNREDRLQELKREVNDLCCELARPVRYASQESDGSEKPASVPASKP